MKIETQAYNCDRCGVPLEMANLVIADVRCRRWLLSDFFKDTSSLWPSKEFHWCESCWEAISEPAPGWLDKQLNSTER